MICVHRLEEMKNGGRRGSGKASKGVRRGNGNKWTYEQIDTIPIGAAIECTVTQFTQLRTFKFGRREDLWEVFPAVTAVYRASSFHVMMCPGKYARGNGTLLETEGEEEARCVTLEL